MASGIPLIISHTILARMDIVPPPYSTSFPNGKKAREANFLDLTGQRFGRLTVIKEADKYISPQGLKFVQWLCKCDCGNDTIVLATNLKKRHY